MRTHTILCLGIAALIVMTFTPTPALAESRGEVAKDNEPCEEPAVGGDPCTSNNDCNYAATLNEALGNRCNFTLDSNHTSTGSGICSCSEKYAKSDCTYKRYEKGMPGGFQFFFLAGIGGVGNFMIGRTTVAVFQLLLLLSEFCGICIGCIGLCAAMAGSSTSFKIGGAAEGVLACCICLAILAGWIWCLVDAINILVGAMPDGNNYYPFEPNCIIQNA